MREVSRDGHLPYLIDVGQMLFSGRDGYFGRGLFRAVPVGCFRTLYFREMKFFCSLGVISIITLFW